MFRNFIKELVILTVFHEPLEHAKHLIYLWQDNEQHFTSLLTQNVLAGQTHILLLVKLYFLRTPKREFLIVKIFKIILIVCICAVQTKWTEPKLDINATSASNWKILVYSRKHCSDMETIGCCSGPYQISYKGNKKVNAKRNSDAVLTMGLPAEAIQEATGQANRVQWHMFVLLPVTLLL